MKEDKLNAIFKDLEANAYNPTYHNYYFKEANQIIRKHFEALLSKETEEKEGCTSFDKFDYSQINDRYK